MLESDSLDYFDPAIRQQADTAKRLDGIVAKATSAFANSGGGVLVLGVDESPKGEPIRSDPPGFPAMYGRERADDHIGKIITRCVVPRPAATVYQRDIKNTDRAYLLVDIAPRGAGPHQVRNTGNSDLDGRYYIRLGRESVVADHYQLRQLFAEALESATRVREYLERFGFGDPEKPFFVEKVPALLLMEPGKATPAQAAAVITVVPEVLRGEMLDTDREEIQKLLERVASDAVLGSESRPTLEGRMSAYPHAKAPFLESYFHVHRTGFIEATHVNVVREEGGQQYVFADASAQVLRAALLAAAKVHAIADTRDRLQVALHVRKANGTHLAVKGRERGSVGTFQRPGMTIAATFPLDQLADTRTVAYFDHRLAQAYGHNDGLVYKLDGSKQPERIFF